MTSTSLDVAQRITEFVLHSTPRRMPAEALAQAKIGVIDSLGVALAGSLEESSLICADFARHEGGWPEASIIGRDFKVSTSQAAFANGAALHALDFDHSFLGLGQPTAPILPAVLAVAEARGVSGAELLAAYLTGFEVTGKLGASLAPGAGEGWHSPGTVGAVGASAGAAKILGLDATQLPMALGVICSMAGAVTANFGTMTKPLHVANAARDGVTAAKLASAGFTAGANAFQARNGFYSLFFGGNANVERIDELGKSYTISDEGLRLKPYPCGGLTHAAIGATLAIRDAHNLTPDDIESVGVMVRRNIYNTIAFKAPRNETEGKFCMPYLIARTIIDGTITLDTFTDEAIRDPAVLALASKVEMRTDGTTERPSDVTIRMGNGETYHESVLLAKGGKQSPLSQAEIEAKFMDCAARAISESQSRELLAMLLDLDHLADVRELTKLLAATT